MDARYLTTADMIHTQILLVSGILLPSLLAVDILHNLLSQRDSRTTGMVEFMHMMRLLHLHVILRELVHDLCQITVHGREDGHTDREVRSPEERLTIGTGLTNLVAMFLHPASRATHHLDAFRPGLQVVTISRLRRSELNCHISRRKCRTVKILLIVNIDDTHNLMTTVAGNLLYHLTHFSVTD